MSVLETILYFVVPTVGMYVLIALLVAGPKLARKQRYRVGQPWPYEPMFWTANPEGAHLSAADDARGRRHPGRCRARRCPWQLVSTVTARSPCRTRRICRWARW